MSADLLQWVNLLLVPVTGLLMGIRSDLAATRATLEAHDHRLTMIETANRGHA